MSYYHTWHSRPQLSYKWTQWSTGVAYYWIWLFPDTDCMAYNTWPCRHCLYQSSSSLVQINTIAPILRLFNYCLRTIHYTEISSLTALSALAAPCSLLLSGAPGESKRHNLRAKKPWSQHLLTPTMAPTMAPTPPKKLSILPRHLIYKYLDSMGFESEYFLRKKIFCSKNGQNCDSWGVNAPVRRPISKASVVIT